MRLDEIQHQPRAVSLLRRAAAAGRAHHAYLFAGPAGVGKEQTARALAARYLCLNAPPATDAEPCQNCEACRLFASGNHPDFHPIHRGLHKLHPDRAVRASKGLYIAVDIIRHFLIDHAANAPALGHNRVFIIRDAERMNEGAQNALLKTLEEPPPSTRLILVSASAERLLTTIRSRCQLIPFDPLPTSYLRAQLRAANVSAEHADLLANLAGGRLGVALQWAAADLPAALTAVDRMLVGSTYTNPESFAKGLLDHANELAARLLEAEADQAEDLDQNGKSSRSVETDDLRAALKLIFMLIATLASDALRAQATAALPASALGCQSPAELARRLASDHLADVIEAAAESEQLLDRNVNPQLVCEQLAVRLDAAARALS